MSTPNAEKRALMRRETATVLAALRWYQESGLGDPAKRPNQIHDIATDGGEVISLDSLEIDRLCAKLNGEEPKA